MGPQTTLKCAIQILFCVIISFPTKTVILAEGSVSGIVIAFHMSAVHPLNCLIAFFSNTLFHTFFALILLFIQLFPKILSGMVNSVDPDQTAPDLDLYCLHMLFCQKLWYMKF